MVSAIKRKVDNVTEMFLKIYTAPRRPKLHRHSEDRELNQARSEPVPVDRPVRTAHTIVHCYNGTQYCNIETVLLIFTFLQTNITSQMWLSVSKEGAHYADICCPLGLQCSIQTRHSPVHHNRLSRLSSHSPLSLRVEG